MDRAADKTLKGYFYQFDYSILQLLSLSSENDCVTVEGIEDVDIKLASEETAIQCKYYAATEYNHSVISKAIRLMLNHFKDVKDKNKNRIKYKLYGCYNSGQDKLPATIDIDFLKKNFLTYSEEKIKYEHHSKLGLSDQDLLEFIGILIIDINAQTYEEQTKTILNIFQKKFDCKELEADIYFYNNALRAIKDLSILPDILHRNITQREFLLKIDNSKFLFNEWYIRLNGKEKYYANLKKKHFSAFNIEPIDRFFLIEYSSSGNSFLSLKDLLLMISSKYSKTSKREPNPYVPYVYIYNILDEELLKIKKQFILDNFYFWDGYDYQNAEFNPKSISKKPDNTTGIKLKLLNSMVDLINLLNYSATSKEIFQFYVTEPFFENPSQSAKCINIQVEDFAETKLII